jgi:hypothetical protein
MLEIESLLKNVEILEQRVGYLVHAKDGNILDSEINKSSKTLNDAINEYNKILESKMHYVEP